MSEAGAAFARGEAPGFWIVTAAIMAALAADLRRPAPDRLDLSGRSRAAPAALLAGDRLRASGWPRRGRPGRTLSGRATTIITRPV